MDRPILFSAPMVRALLDGRKTQTRRILKPQPEPEFISAEIRANGFSLTPAYLFGGPTFEMLHRLARPGTRLWVREAWRAPSMNDHVKPSDLARGMARQYEADGEALYGDGPFAVPAPIGSAGKLRPSMFMPRWASRLTLIVTDVRVQRLQEISEEDARAEGIADGGCLTCGQPEPCGCEKPLPDARDSFAHLWGTINGPDAWAANPWVVALTFDVHRANIDALPPPPAPPAKAKEER